MPGTFVVRIHDDYDCTAFGQSQPDTCEAWIDFAAFGIADRDGHTGEDAEQCGDDDYGQGQSRQRTNFRRHRHTGY